MRKKIEEKTEKYKTQLLRTSCDTKFYTKNIIIEKVEIA
jgi:hypothetical protein